MLPSDSSRKYFPDNTVANYRTKLAALIEFNTDEWEVGLVEISCPSGFTGVNTIDTSKHNVLVLEFGVVLFPVRRYMSFNDLYKTLKSSLHSNETQEELQYFYLLPHKLFGPHMCSTYGENEFNHFRVNKN
jgi:hypothetical protein